LASCEAPIRQDCSETSEKSEVVTACSWQFAGEERLQSTAETLIMTKLRRRPGHLHHLFFTQRRLVLLLHIQISWWEYAVIYRAGFANEAGSLVLGLRDKSNNLAHIRSKHQLDNEFAI
jgi:hypothetical protein